MEPNYFLSCVGIIVLIVGALYVACMVGWAFYQINENKAAIEREENRNEERAKRLATVEGALKVWENGKTN